MSEQNYVMFADSDCDISLEVCREYGYNLISMPFIAEGKEIWPYETWKEFDASSFYNTLRKGSIPKTFGLSPEKYISYFRPFFEQGKDILYIHFSKEMSGTFNAMNLAVQMLKEEFPERKFIALDTKAITGLALVILKEAGKMYKNGASMGEIVEAVENDFNKHYSFYAFIDDLKFFKASGRLNGISAVVGTMLGIKPMISLGDDGKLGVVGKCRGTKGAVRTLMERIEQLGDDVPNHIIQIVHSDAPELVKLLIVELKKKFGDDIKIEVDPVNPTAGIHAGPDCAGVAFHSKRRQL